MPRFWQPAKKTSWMTQAWLLINYKPQILQDTHSWDSNDAEQELRQDLIPCLHPPDGPGHGEPRQDLWIFVGDKSNPRTSGKQKPRLFPRSVTVTPGWPRAHCHSPGKVQTKGALGAKSWSRRIPCAEIPARDGLGCARGVVSPFQRGKKESGVLGLGNSTPGGMEGEQKVHFGAKNVL